MHGVRLVAGASNSGAPNSATSAAEDCASEASESSSHMHVDDDVEALSDSAMTTVAANGGKASKSAVQTEVPEEADRSSAQWWLGWQQAMIRIASSVHMVMQSLLEMHGPHACIAGERMNAHAIDTF
jgi:hypothetical protein